MRYLISKGLPCYCLDADHIFFTADRIPKLVGYGVRSLYGGRPFVEADAVEAFGVFARHSVVREAVIPARLAQLLARCTSDDADARPTFSALESSLKSHRYRLDDIDMDQFNAYLEYLGLEDKFPFDEFMAISPFKRYILRAAVAGDPVGRGCLRDGGQDLDQIPEEVVKPASARAWLARKLLNGDWGWTQNFHASLWLFAQLAQHFQLELVAQVPDYPLEKNTFSDQWNAVRVLAGIPTWFE
jgi:hypothetical protein